MVMQAFGIVLLKYFNPVQRSEPNKKAELFRKSATSQSTPEDNNTY